MSAREGYVERMRRAIGTDLLLLPSVAVLPRDSEERVLLVKHAFSGTWGLVGGAIEVGESPAEAAVRETAEEVGLEIELGPIVAAVGGPEYELEYRNGDRVAYVAVVYEARVVGGTAKADQVEVTETSWFRTAEMAELELNSFARALLTQLGYLP